MKPKLQDIIDWIKHKLQQTIQVKSEDIDVNKDFSEYGLDSLNAVSLVGEIEQWLNLELPATTLWDYPTIYTLAVFLDKELQQVSH